MKTTLKIDKSCSEIDKQLATKYWKKNKAGEWAYKTDELLKQYNIKNYHLLNQAVNAASTLSPEQKCNHPGCNKKHKFNSRSSLEGTAHSKFITIHFKDFYSLFPSKTKHIIRGGPTKISSLFDNHTYYCDIHGFTKEKEKVRLSKFEPAIKVIIKQIEDDGFTLSCYEGIKKMEWSEKDRNLYFLENCIESKLGTDKVKAWKIYSDYWLLDQNHNWVFSISELCSMYKITEQILTDFICGDYFVITRIYVESLKKGINSRKEYLENAIWAESAKEHNESTGSSKFDDSPELSGALRKISKTLGPGDKYYLMESADHIDGLYKSYKKAVNNKKQAQRTTCKECAFINKFKPAGLDKYILVCHGLPPQIFNNIKNEGKHYSLRPMIKKEDLSCSLFKHK